VCPLLAVRCLVLAANRKALRSKDHRAYLTKNLAITYSATPVQMQYHRRNGA
jgi:hypothetical protein